MDWLAQWRIFRVFWAIPVAWALHFKWNAPYGHEMYNSMYRDWIYAFALSDMLNDGYLSPSDAIDEDRHYWTD